MAKSPKPARKNNPSPNVPIPNQSGHHIVGAQLQTVYSAGPLPHPDILARYDAVLAGAADRIVARFEQQGEHRQQMEARALEVQADNLKRQADLAARAHESQFRTTRLGQIFAFVIALTVLSGSFYCIVSGHDVSGTILAGGSLGTLVGIFIYGSRSGANPASDQKAINDPPKS